MEKTKRPSGTHERPLSRKSGEAISNDLGGLAVVCFLAHRADVVKRDQQRAGATLGGP